MFKSVCVFDEQWRRMETVPLQREAETQWSLQKPLVSAAWVLSLEWAVTGLFSHSIPHQPQGMVTYKIMYFLSRFLKSDYFRLKRFSCAYVNFNRNVGFLLEITTSSKAKKILVMDLFVMDKVFFFLKKVSPNCRSISKSVFFSFVW